MLQAQVRIRILKTIPILTVLTDSELSIVANSMSVQIYKDGDYIVRQQEEPGAGGGQIPGQGPADARAGAGDHCYFILEVFHSCCSDSV